MPWLCRLKYVDEGSPCRACRRLVSEGAPMPLPRQVVLLIPLFSPCRFSNIQYPWRRTSSLS